jgi:hypothetical protein
LQTASKHFSDDWNVRFPESLNLILNVMHRYNSDEHATMAQMSAAVGERDFHLHHLAAEDA